MKWKTLSFLLSSVCCVLLTTPVGAQTGKGMVIFADAIYYNGKVLTVDERFSVAQALAVRDGKVMAAGTNSEILNLAGPKSRRLDLKGKTVLPGFIDTHSHLFQYAAANWADNLGRSQVLVSVAMGFDPHRVATCERGRLPQHQHNVETGMIEQHRR